MLKPQFHKLIHSRSFVVTFIFSIAVIVIPTMIKIVTLFGSPDISLAPAWYYFGDLEAMISSPLSMVKGPYLMFILPLSCSILYSAAYFDDSSENIIPLLFTRSSKYRYWGSGIFLTFASAFMLVFIPLLLSRILICLAVPLESLKFSPGYPINGDIAFHNVKFWKGLVIQHPYLYFFIYTCIPALYGALLSVASYALSLLLRKRRILIVFLPGICSIIYDFVLSYLGHISLVAYNVINPPFGIIGIEATDVFGFFLVVIFIDILLIITGFIKNRDVLPYQ